MSSEVKVEEKEEEEDQTIIHGQVDEEDDNGEEDDDDEDDEDDDDGDDGEGEEEEDLNFASPTTSSEDPSKISSTLAQETPSITIATSTIADPVVSAIETPLTHVEKKPQITPETTAEKKPFASDESRKLFQRLWTDEDEIGLLQGYLDFTIQRGTQNSSYHHDTGLFYDQIKTRLQLDFNKSQLVEKLRRLKKKYRNVMARISAGKDVSFKSLHDQATFEIARKIWGDNTVGGGGGGVLQEDAGVDDDEGNQNHLISSNVNVDIKPIIGNKEKKPFGTPTPRRAQKRAAENDLSNLPKFRVTSSIPNAIEDTVRSCLSPLFKELINCATNGPCNLGGLGGVALNPLPLSFGGKSSANLSGGDKLDERWRKQQILELEVYSKRIELVQDQIKLALEDLRSMDDRR